MVFEKKEGKDMKQFGAIIVFGFLTLLGAATILVSTASADLCEDGYIPLLVSQADVVFYGEVVHVEYETVDNSKNEAMPYSIYDVKILKGYRGVATGEVFRMYANGGRLQEGGRIIVPGSPILRKTDRVVVFHNAALDPLIGTVGGSAGILRVVREGTEDIVLDNFWRPIAGDVRGRMVVEHRLRCVPGKTDRGICETWEDVADEPDESFDDPVSDMPREDVERAALDLDDLDALLGEYLMCGVPERSAAKAEHRSLFLEKFAKDIEP